MRRSQGTQDSHAGSRPKNQTRQAILETDDIRSDYDQAYYSPYTSQHRIGRDPFTTDYGSDDHLHATVQAAQHRGPRNIPVDFIHDPRSSPSTPETYLDEPIPYEDPYHDSRVSYLGPKMRFHSRAPWEMEDSSLDEEQEPLESPKHHGFSFSIRGSNNHKGSAASLYSPRSSDSSSRGRSAASIRSVPPKRSFDTINSQISSRGALYALAQESLSVSSLPRHGDPGSTESSRYNKFLSSNRAGPQSIVANDSPFPPDKPSPTRSYYAPKAHLQSSFPGNANVDETYDGVGNDGSGFTEDEQHDVHPYANPDLIVTYEPDPISPSSATVTQHSPLLRNLSSVTVKQASIHPDHGGMAQDAPLHPQDLSVTVSRTRMSSIQGKGISSPVALQASSFPVSSDTKSNRTSVVPANLHGWTERSAPPSFNLISLEEARAQRTRNSVLPGELLSRTQSSAISISSKTTSTFTHQDPPLSTSPSSASIMTTRSRGRTISAGSKAKDTIRSIVGNIAKGDSDENPESVSQPPTTGKSLKHKKSGFMRLFNGGKEKEEDLPPVPLLKLDSGGVDRKGSQPLAHDAPLRGGIAESAPSATYKSPLPNLSIVTSTPGHHNRGTGSDGDQDFQNNSLTLQSPSRPWLPGQPKSAPAEALTFPALRLRPVSALFSSHFVEHIVPDLQSSTGRVDTPLSSNSQVLTSPVTPPHSEHAGKHGLDATVESLKIQLEASRSDSQRKIRELEKQVRKMALELGELRSKRYDASVCPSCGYGQHASSASRDVSPSRGRDSFATGQDVATKPSTKTGNASRFATARS